MTILKFLVTKTAILITILIKSGGKMILPDPEKIEDNSEELGWREAWLELVKSLSILKSNVLVSPCYNPNKVSIFYIFMFPVLRNILNSEFHCLGVGGGWGGGQVDNVLRHHLQHRYWHEGSTIIHSQHLKSQGLVGEYDQETWQMHQKGWSLAVPSSGQHK